LHVIGIDLQCRLERLGGIGTVVFLCEQLAPPDVGGYVIGRERIRLAEVGIGLLELTEHAFSFAEANEIGGGILRARRNHPLEGARPFRPLAKIELQAAELQRRVASRSGRRGRRE
jgi:hypothetical protein